MGLSVSLRMRLGLRRVRLSVSLRMRLGLRLSVSLGMRVRLWMRLLGRILLCDLGHVFGVRFDPLFHLVRLSLLDCGCFSLLDNRLVHFCFLDRFAWFGRFWIFTLWLLQCFFLYGSRLTGGSQWGGSGFSGALVCFDRLDLSLGRRNRFGRKCFRDWRLLNKLLTNLFGLTLRESVPTSIHLCLAELFYPSRLSRRYRFQFCRWRNYLEQISLRLGSESSVALKLRRIVYFIIRDLLPLSLNELGYPFVLGTVIVNYVIVIGYVGDVLGAIDNRHVLLRRNDEFPVRGPAKISDPNESEGGRPDIIITVAP